MSPPAIAPRSVAVLGAGFSGVALAVALLRLAHRPLQITLVERRPALGCGVAYGTGHPRHLLNVPAGRMGVDPLDEAGFARYLVMRGHGGQAHDFVARALYADYLCDALQSAADTAAPGVGWAWRRAEAVDCDGSSVAFRDSASLQADAVVLASGHLPPQPPVVPQGPAWTEAGLVPDPWSPGALDAVAADARVLLLGSGLTAFDVLLQLRARGHSGMLTMASRRGLMPQAHRRLELPPQGGLVPPDALHGVRNVRQLLRGLRDMVQQAQAAGHDWRDVVAGLRPATAGLWQQLPENERSRFVRHLQPFWDTHRHRTAPQVWAEVMAYLASGRVQALAARMTALHPAEGGGWQIALRARGSWACTTIRADWVINCTGPSSDARHSADPLMSQLVRSGAVAPDSLGLGLRVGPDYRLGTGGLRYLGPLLKAGWWEAVAVPELRVHANQLARLLVDELGVS